MAIDFPNTPTLNDTFVAAGITYTFNGYGWAAGGAAETGAHTVSDTPPASPAQGDLWLESDTMIMWMWYEDPNGGQWVQVNASPAPPATVSSFMTMQSFLTGTGTYTTPAGCTRIRVRMVGGGGGGAASAAGATAGTATTFGPMNCGGGDLGAGGNPGGVGGTASLGAGPLGIAMPGSAGGATQRGTANSYWGGGSGGTSPLGGAGGGGVLGLVAQQHAAPNSGSGGGGYGGNAVAAYSGGGGGSGGYIDACINAPAATYAYAVGAGGTGGTNGGAGGSGGIWVEEYY